MAETVAFSSPADEKLALELVAKRTKALKTRIAELEQALNNFLQLYPNISQLLNGWHADGTAWTEWDESVRRELTAVGEAARKVMEPR